MKAMVYKDFSFDSAHRLPSVAATHKCSRLHGHTYRARVWCQGDIGTYDGWVLDYSEIQAAVNPLIEQLDHYYLNDIKGLENPTCEHIGQWLWERLKPALPMLSKIELGETCSAGCVVEG